MDFLNNTNIVVAIGFVIFIGILIYYKVPAMLAAKLDERSVRIRADLDEARALRDEAQALLAAYERRQKEVAVQAEEIVTAARQEALRAAEAAKVDIRATVDRRLAAATEQIAAAGDVLKAGLQPQDAEQLIARSIDEVGTKLH